MSGEQDNVGGCDPQTYIAKTAAHSVLPYSPASPKSDRHLPAFSLCLSSLLPSAEMIREKKSTFRDTHLSAVCKCASNVYNKYLINVCLCVYLGSALSLLTQIPVQINHLFTSKTEFQLI